MSGSQQLLQAESLKQLQEGIDAISPKRLTRSTDGRTTSSRERWVLRHYFGARILQGDLHFPLFVAAEDRPDFRIVEGDIEYGLEVTEAIHTMVSKARAVAAQQGIKAYSEGALARKNPRVSDNSAALQAHLNDPSKHGDCYIGSEVERELEELLRERISAKLESLNKPDFRKFASNQLLIYENSGLPAID